MSHIIDGVFISFEGGEGAGKSTQIQMLHDYLKERGLPVVMVRDPGSTDVAEKIRAILKDTESIDICTKTEALLYIAARAQLACSVIRPYLSKGFVVLCDRFTHSTMAYQGFGNGLNIEDLQYINNFATSGLVPNITFFLDIDPSEGLRRKMNQDKLDRIELKGLEYHEQIASGFRQLAAGCGHIITIDAARPKNEIHGTIITHIDKFLQS